VPARPQPRRRCRLRPRPRPPRRRVRRHPQVHLLPVHRRPQSLVRIPARVPARAPVRRAPSRVVRPAQAPTQAPLLEGPALGRRPLQGSQVAPHRRRVPHWARVVRPRLAPTGRSAQIRDRLEAPPAPAPTTVPVAMPMPQRLPTPVGSVLRRRRLQVRPVASRGSREGRIRLLALGSPAAEAQVLQVVRVLDMLVAGRLAVRRPPTSNARPSINGSMRRWLLSITTSSTSRMN
jgi:hypothetical protein